MSHGTMIVGGIPVPIRSVEVTRGFIRFTGSLPGPVAEQPDAVISIFGSDGKGVLQSQPFPLQRILPGQIMVLTYDLVVQELTP